MPAVGQNPYAHPASPGDGSAPNPSGNYIWGGPGRYSVPDIPDTTDPDYLDGYSPALAAGGSTDGTMLPDEIRIGVRKPPPNDPNNRAYNNLRQSEKIGRHAVEQTTDGNWTEVQNRPNRPPRPEESKPSIRPTATQAPVDNLLRRPWHIPRNAVDALGPNAELHVSMADHRRNYEIMGMQPRGGVGVNTYRASTAPWDQNLFIPPEQGNVDAPGFVGNRPYRLT